jgi:FkbM family methyltransferase
MTYLLFKKHVRRWAAKLGILGIMKMAIVRLRGGKDQHQKALEWFSRFIKPGQLVFDVGANRGQSSDLFLKLGARVVAFEPQTDLHEEIRQVCRKNPNLIIEDCGLSDREETRILHVTAYDQVASLREDWEGVRIGQTEIKLSTLDRQIERHGRPDYCKIDVEGWELQVLSGLHQPIAAISFEYHLTPSEIEHASKVLEKISSLGLYHCNLKQETANDFLLPHFLPLMEFRRLFPNQLGHPLKDGYGDIYCILDPSECQSAKGHD